MVKCGGYRYEDGTRYIGDWNHKGQKHGMGHLVLPGEIVKIAFKRNAPTKFPFSISPDGTRYDGSFVSGLCSGLGVMTFADGAK